VTQHLVFHQFDLTQHVAGGIPGYVYDLVRLAPEPHEFAVVGVTTSRFRALGRWENINIDGRSVAFMPVARLDPGDQKRRVPHSARFVAGISRFRPRRTNALVHSHRVDVGAALSVLFRHERHVLFLHGPGEEALRHRVETFWRWSPRGFNAVELFAARRAERTIVMHTETTNRLLKQGAHAVLGKHWFDGDCFYPSREDKPRGDLRIGWVGRLEPPKDPLLAIRVLQALADRDVPFSAWIAGAGTMEQEVREAVTSSGLDDRVELLGLLRPNEIAEQLRGSTVCLMTSRFEGFPRSAVEALGCGVPLVSTDVGDLATFVQEGVNGYLLPAGDVSALAQRLVDSSALRRGEPIAATVDHIEARNVIRELFAVLDSIAIS
jgi:glycosyltransferase involved in cell wall biosynthesis